MKYAAVVSKPTSVSGSGAPGVPKPSLTFRVGIVGHRPGRLGGADLHQLRTVIRDILSVVEQEVQDFQRQDGGRYYGKERTRLVAVSPLAEGADRLFAEIALELQFELCCVMPFPEEEFIKDFETAESQTAFRGLLERAAKGNGLTRYELGGDRISEPTAYGACGEVVVDRSDVLVVITDGQRKNKRGGTEESIDYAASRGVPMVVITAAAPHQAGLVLDGEDHPIDRLGAQVRNLLEPPDATGAAPNGSAQAGRDGIDTFYAEEKPASNRVIYWRLFRAVIAGAWRLKPRRRRRSNVPTFEEQALAEWPPPTSPPLAALLDQLRRFYAWPNGLAVTYSDLYRSAFVVMFLAAASAVGLALAAWLLGLEPHGAGEILIAFVEFFTIGGILVLVRAARRGRWHEQWIEYRFVAEIVRGLRLVTPLGGGRLVPYSRAEPANRGSPGATWMAWYTYAIERSCSLPNVRVDSAYLGVVLAQLRAVLEGQVRYHRGNADQCDRLERRLRRAGVALFATTFAACAVHIAFSVFPSIHQREWIARLLTTIAAFLPAVGASLAGIADQAELRRLVRGSEAMHHQLVDRIKRTAALERRLIADGGRPLGPLSKEVTNLSVETASLLIKDVLGWRLVFLDRPLEAKG